MSSYRSTKDPNVYLSSIGASVPLGGAGVLSQDLRAWLATASDVPQYVAPAADVTTVTPAQAKVALFNAGLLDRVDAALVGSYRPIQIYWEAASSFERSHPYIQGIAALLGLSDAEVDTLFAQAALL